MISEIFVGNSISPGADFLETIAQATNCSSWEFTQTLRCRDLCIQLIVGLEACEDHQASALLEQNQSALAEIAFFLQQRTTDIDEAHLLEHQLDLCYGCAKRITRALTVGETWRQILTDLRVAVAGLEPRSSAIMFRSLEAVEGSESTSPAIVRCQRHCMLSNEN